MEEKVKERIRLLLKDKGLSFNAISETPAVQAQFSRAFGKGKSARLSYDLIEIVLNKFPDISADWLLTGDGEKYKSVSELPTVDVSSEDRINESAELGKITRKYNEAAEMIEQLKKKVALLEKTLEEERKDKERAIAQLDLASSLLRERLMMAESAQKVG